MREILDRVGMSTERCWVRRRSWLGRRSGGCQRVGQSGTLGRRVIRCPPRQDCWFNQNRAGTLRPHGTALLAGRDVDAERDNRGSPKWAIVNEVFFCTGIFGGENPVWPSFASGSGGEQKEETDPATQVDRAWGEDEILRSSARISERMPDRTFALWGQEDTHAARARLCVDSEQPVWHRWGVASGRAADAGVPATTVHPV